tara:strand:- start:81 stop:560 length:480 start_codon:yes stop_codon:yes gene_type:complete
MAKNKGKLKFKDIAKLVTEDSTIQADKWATGISGRYHRPQQLTLLDLLKKHDDQHPNFVKVAQNMPHNAQMMVELIGDSVLKVADITAAIEMAKSNPIIEDNEKAHLRLDTILNKTKRIKEIVESIGEDIDTFSITLEEESPAGKSPWDKKEPVEKEEK